METKISILLVDADERRRSGLRQALVPQGFSVYEAIDPGVGMNILSKTEVDALLVAEGERRLALVGLCAQARRQFPQVRIFIRLLAQSAPAELERLLGVPFTALAAGADAHAAAGIVRAALQVAPPSFDEFDWEPPPAVAAPAPVQAAAALPDAALARAPAPALVSPPAAPARELQQGAGEGELLVLQACFAQRTGVLHAHSAGRASSLAAVFFQRGEPVWCEPAAGDAGVYADLVADGLVPADAPVVPVAEGELLASLVRSGHLDVEALRGWMRGRVRAAVVAAITARELAWSFDEVPAYVDAAPLLKLNALGLVLDHRRGRVSADRLLAIAHELQHQRLSASTGLEAALAQVAPFVGSQDLAAAIASSPTLESFAASTGLDVMMATLLVSILVDAGVLSLGAVSSRS